jgi:uncharacterized membrane protein YkvA (DUF1232 family)
MKLGERLLAWARRIRQHAVTLWFACRDVRAPWHARLLAAVVVAYALSPIDLIPDFIPVLGYLDDVLLLPALIWLAVRALPADVMADARREADAWIARSGARPRSIAGGVAIVSIWLLVATLIGHAWLTGRAG